YPSEPHEYFRRRHSQPDGELGSFPLALELDLKPCGGRSLGIALLRDRSLAELRRQAQQPAFPGILLARPEDLPRIQDRQPASYRMVEERHEGTQGPLRFVFHQPDESLEPARGIQQRRVSIFWTLCGISAPA